MNKKIVSKKNLKVGLVIGLLFFMVVPSTVYAQIQLFDFSGNDPNSYQCYDDSGETYLNGEGVEIYKDAISGYYLCRGFNHDDVAGDDRAVLRPPALQQVEIWFVRILYVIWALVGSFSFFFLVLVGYQYLLRGGTSDTELVTLRKRIINYAIGFALVFLAVPILSTVFRLLGVNSDVACYNVNMPAFQFFFTDVCTGNDTLLRNACQTGDPIDAGLACPTPGRALSCDDLLGTTTPPERLRTFFCNAGALGERSTWTDYNPNL